MYNGQGSVLIRKLKIAIMLRIDKLTASGQEIDHGDQFGRTPLMFTILADRLECAELLLRAGANVNCKDKGGRTALHWAAHKVGSNRKEID